MGDDDLYRLFGNPKFINFIILIMGRTELQILIVGAILPPIISLLKRWVVLSKQQNALLTIGVCFVVVSIFELIECSFNFEQYLSRLATVFGASQIVYQVIMKPNEIDRMIEG